MALIANRRWPKEFSKVANLKSLIFNSTVNIIRKWDSEYKECPKSTKIGTAIARNQKI